MTTYKNRLPQSALMGYISPAPHKTGAGIGTPLTTYAHNRAQAVFLCVKYCHIRIMVGRTGQPKGWPGSCVAGSSNPVRLTTQSLEPLGGELSQLTTYEGYPSWQTANSATPAPTFSASTHKQKSPASSTVLIRWHTSFAPNYLTCLATACRYGCLPSWTTSPTISATFSDCLTSQRTPRKAPMRPCSSGAFVYPVNREVWL
ncbi:TPA: ash family protein [Salmonella enterica subsp. enterica serovar Muenchen]|nr:ash family protein [Salmonella enterica]HEC9707193.1 ash family protein [Salmonella enterica subsp. enterica serovar Muenchen]